VNGRIYFLAGVGGMAQGLGWRRARGGGGGGRQACCGWGDAADCGHQQGDLCVLLTRRGGAKAGWACYEWRTILRSLHWLKWSTGCWLQ